jgi:mono/diheme cytochrome c family protein
MNRPLHRIHRISVVVAVVIVVAVVGSGGGCRRPAPVDEPIPAPRTLRPAEKLVADLHLFVGQRGTSDADVARAAGDLESGKVTVDNLVDALLKRPLDGGFAKDLLLGGSQGIKDLHPLPRSMVLKQSKGDDARYFLRKECAAKDAVDVAAWWGVKVKVCPDAYRPEVKGDDIGRTCGASFLNPSLSDVCGCGPALMWCTRDNAHWEKVKADAQREVTDTVSWVINNDQPIEKIFSMNETVRGENAESVYRRSRVLSGEPVDKVYDRTDWPRDGVKTPVPRFNQVPGQHAGILTTPSMIYGSDALRGVMRNYFDYLWCSTNSASRVTTAAVLGLDVVDLRVGDGWKQLAHMNICTDCHARLDYGMQFFHGWPSSTMGIDFRPRDALKGPGKFYGANIRDERGSGELNPEGFAKLVVGQPEFGDCMSRRVTDHVFNGTARPEDFAAVRKTFSTEHTLKGMLRTAMVRYADVVLRGRPPEAPAAPSSNDAVAAAADAPDVTLSSSLRRRLDAHCMECHDKGDDFDFNGASLPRDVVEHMLEQVGFGVMPKTAEGLSGAEREALIADLSGVLFGNESERKIAVEWFTSAFRPHPVHRYRSTFDTVAQRAGGARATVALRGVESAVDQANMVFSPTMAVSAGVAALKECRAKHKDPRAVEVCVNTASAPEGVVVGGL